MNEELTTRNSTTKLEQKPENLFKIFMGDALAIIAEEDGENKYKNIFIQKGDELILNEEKTEGLGKIHKFTKKINSLTEEITESKVEIIYNSILENFKNYSGTDLQNILIKIASECHIQALTRKLTEKYLDLDLSSEKISTGEALFAKYNDLLAKCGTGELEYSPESNLKVPIAKALYNKLPKNEIFESIFSDLLKDFVVNDITTFLVAFEQDKSIDPNIKLKILFNIADTYRNVVVNEEIEDGLLNRTHQRLIRQSPDTSIESTKLFIKTHYSSINTDIATSILDTIVSSSETFTSENIKKFYGLLSEEWFNETFKDDVLSQENINTVGNIINKAQNKLSTKIHNFLNQSFEKGFTKLRKNDIDFKIYVGRDALKTYLSMNSQKIILEKNKEKRDRIKEDSISVYRQYLATKDVKNIAEAFALCDFSKKENILFIMDQIKTVRDKIDPETRQAAIKSIREQIIAGSENIKSLTRKQKASLFRYFELNFISDIPDNNLKKIIKQTKDLEKLKTILQRENLSKEIQKLAVERLATLSNKKGSGKDGFLSLSTAIINGENYSNDVKQFVAESLVKNNSHQLSIERLIHFAEKNSSADLVDNIIKALKKNIEKMEKTPKDGQENFDVMQDQIIQTINALNTSITNEKVLLRKPAKYIKDCLNMCNDIRKINEKRQEVASGHQVEHRLQNLENHIKNIQKIEQHNQVESCRT